MDILIWKQLLQNLVLPPAGPLIVAAVGLALSATARLRRTGLVLCGAALALLWVLATPLTADALLRWAQIYPALDATQPLEAQAIVILGGGVRAEAPEYHSVAPSSTTLERLVYGARLARATALPVLVSGTHFEAAAMTDILRRDLGVTAMWVENRSRDTYENAQKSRPILAQADVQTIVLVTSAVHMARARVEFERAGFRVIPAPTAIWSRRDIGFLPWLPTADALARSQHALHEDLGRFVQSLQGSLARARLQRS